MAIYAIGDVQGCFASLERLIDHIQFDPSLDRLWFVGDLVNRGPESVRVLRLLKKLGASARVVLGNHDLFLLAVAESIMTLRPKDSIQDVLEAEDRLELLGWLRHQPLHYREGSYFMVHAGLLPQWTISEAERLAQGVSEVLSGPDYKVFLHSVFHDAPAQWQPALQGMQRLAATARVLTRLRTCTPDGYMDTGFSGSPDEAPSGHVPWFTIPGRRSTDTTMIFGHWAALGLHVTHNVLAIDSGCVWGRQLTAVRLEDRRVFQVSCGERVRRNE